MVNVSRRQWLRHTGILLGAGALGTHLPAVAASALKASSASSARTFDFSISLAQWSLNKAFFDKSLSPLDFPAVARTNFDIGAVEYVNQFFMDRARDAKFLAALNRRAADHNVKNVLIMVDGEGDLATVDQARRKRSVENHYKWVEAASDLGCTSIRVNLHGSSGSSANWHSASVASLNELMAFARPQGIDILVENHGGFSSNAAQLAGVLKAVDNPHVGSIPDFGNFCYQREAGDLWNSPCVKQYDVYKGVAELMPYAGDISAKTYRFDEQGNEADIDYYRLFNIIKAAGYHGYVGIEYEGSGLPAEEGIRKTKALLEKVRAQLNTAPPA